MVVIGLTGGIATGKSTASEIFKEHGYPVIDCDLIARQVVEPGTRCHANLRSSFGDSLFDPITGQLKREQLGAVIFSDAEKRKLLNSITHTAIKVEIVKQILYYLVTGSTHIILDAPLMFESGINKFLPSVIVIWCDENVELERLMKRDNREHDDALRRIQAQLPISEKKRLGTILIDNNGSKEDTRKQMENLIMELKGSWTPLIVRLVILMAATFIITFMFRLIF